MANRDTLVHVEKTIMPSFGQGEMRNLIVTATGLIGDLPKTVGTGCGKRRKLSQTSREPSHVTCQACREWSRQDEVKWAEMAEGAANLTTDLTQRIEFLEQAKIHRDRAAEFSD